MLEWGNGVFDPDVRQQLLDMVQLLLGSILIDDLVIVAHDRRLPEHDRR